MQFIVGSTNPVKINAVKQAAADHWPQVKVTGVAANSRVSDQPKSDQETKQGAINRAQAALKTVAEPTSAKPTLAVGLEGGVLLDADNQMWTTVWAAVLDQDHQLFLANGGRFLVPSIVASKIIEGKEMGPIMSNYLGGRPVKTQEGLIGVITKKFVDRTSLYASIVSLALGQWYGRDWQNELNLA